MTKHAQLNAEVRTIVGNSLRKLRKQGILPAVIYSKEMTPVSLQLNYLEFLRMFKVTGKSNVIDLTFNNTDFPCIVHNLDIHPVTGKVRHVDFLSVNLKNKVTATVPLEFTGESPAVKEFGAVLMTPIQEIDVQALPDKLPQSIIVDLDKLVALDDVIRVIDLVKSSDYEIVNEQDQVLATLVYESAQEEEIVPMPESPTVAPSESVKN